jgi:predicted negative regulator of RcsB-dependent stress response
MAGFRSMRAVVELGRRRAGKGDRAGAAEAFQLAADSGDIAAGVEAALHLWILWSEAGDLRAADEAYLRAADLVAQVGGFGPDESVADKSLGLGVKIASSWSEFVRPARLAFHRRVNSGDPQAASLAAIGLAGLEMQQAEEPYGTPDPTTVIAALQWVIDSGRPDHVPVAAKWLAFISNQTDDVDAARTALGAVTHFGTRKNACHVALDAGKVFRRTGNTAEAVAALRFVVDNSQTGLAVIAAQDLGELLAAGGDVDGARTAYQFALDRSTFPHVKKTIRAALDRL